jgi:hypothetical protein
MRECGAVVDLAVFAGAFGLGISVYAALEPEPEQIGRRVLFGVGGLAIFTVAVLTV